MKRGYSDGRKNEEMRIVIFNRFHHSSTYIDTDCYSFSFYCFSESFFPFADGKQGRRLNKQKKRSHSTLRVNVLLSIRLKVSSYLVSRS